MDREVRFRLGLWTLHFGLLLAVILIAGQVEAVNYQPPIKISTIPIPTSSHRTPQINDSGQVVWWGDDGSNWAVYHYNNGVAQKINNNHISGSYPQINNAGQVVWTGVDIAGNASDIFLYKDGMLQNISNTYFQDVDPQINNAGQVVWSSFRGVFINSAGVVQNISDNTRVFDPQINEVGEVVWWGVNGSEKDIFFYRGGTIEIISNNDTDDFYPQMNNAGQVVWQSRPSDGSDWAIHLYVDGVVQNISDNTRVYDPQINAAGQVVWAGLDKNGIDYDIYLYSGGVVRNVSNNITTDFNPQINDAGHVVWWGRDINGSDEDIYLYSSGTVQNISNNNTSDRMPQINASDQIAFSNPDDGHIYLANPSKILNISAILNLLNAE